jgi:Fe-Mn family superoxide dismutase
MPAPNKSVLSSRSIALMSKTAYGKKTFYESSFCMPSHIIALPFDSSALSPYISETTVDLHYYKHHKGYANKLTELIANTEYADMSLEQIIETSHAQKDIAIYNNAAQTWNHNFYWKSLCPKGQCAEPSEGALMNAIVAAGGIDSIVGKMVQIGITQFASGWAWLVRTPDGTLDVRKTSNADPVWLNSSDHPILVMDVWEHAYYVDYHNRRGEHLQNLRSILNWSFAQSQFENHQINPSAPANSHHF